LLYEITAATVAIVGGDRYDRGGDGGQTHAE
jgi:hypothetical protein